MYQCLSKMGIFSFANESRKSRAGGNGPLGPTLTNDFQGKLQPQTTQRPNFRTLGSRTGPSPPEASQVIHWHPQMSSKSTVSDVGVSTTRTLSKDPSNPISNRLISDTQSPSLQSLPSNALEVTFGPVGRVSQSNTSNNSGLTLPKVQESKLRQRALRNEDLCKTKHSFGFRKVKKVDFADLSEHRLEIERSSLPQNTSLEMHVSSKPWQGIHVFLERRKKVQQKRDHELVSKLYSSPFARHTYKPLYKASGSSPKPLTSRPNPNSSSARIAFQLPHSSRQQFLDRLMVDQHAYEEYYLADLLKALQTDAACPKLSQFRAHFASSLTFLKRSGLATAPSHVSKFVDDDLVKTDISHSSKIKPASSSPSQKSKIATHQNLNRAQLPTIDMILEDSSTEPAKESTPLSITLRSPDLPRLLVLFDLDETLIRTDIDGEPWGPFTADFELRLGFENTKRFKVSVRPFVRQLLETLARFCDLGVFTASKAGYADSIIDVVDPNQVISRRYYRTDCERQQGVGYVKVLQSLGNDIDLSRTVLVDNFVSCFSRNIANGIPILPYYGDKSDTQIAHLIPFIIHLNGHQDVRLAIQSHFTWGDWVSRL